MPYMVEEFEETPNPNAIKCWLDRRISDRPRSFLNAKMAEEDPIAQALFKKAAATTVLFNGNWVTVNKAPEAPWSTVRRQIREVLAEAEQ
jgi:hypothetical protein